MYLIYVNIHYSKISSKIRCSGLAMDPHSPQKQETLELGEFFKPSSKTGNPDYKLNKFKLEIDNPGLLGHPKICQNKEIMIK